MAVVVKINFNGWKIKVVEAAQRNYMKGNYLNH